MRMMLYSAEKSNETSLVTSDDDVGMGADRRAGIASTDDPTAMSSARRKSARRRKRVHGGGGCGAQRVFERSFDERARRRPRCR
jgi:hypothetical protein